MKKGYTLIELLIVIFLTVILSGFGLAGFINFNRNQVVNNAGKKIVEDLRYTQSLTLNQQKPPAATTTCTVLTGYNFTITSATTGAYSIVAVCSPDCSGTECTVKTNTLNVGVTEIANVFFKILTGGTTITPSGKSNFTLAGNNLTRYVRVCSGGEISFSESLPTCP